MPTIHTFNSAGDGAWGNDTVIIRDDQGNDLAHCHRYFAPAIVKALGGDEFVPATQHRAEAGTLFACSWGYDQTNVDYYVVLSRTAKMAYIARIKQGDVEHIGREVAAGRGHKLPSGTLERVGRFKIHDAAMGGRDGLRDIESRYALWFAPYSFANAYWWRGEEMYQTPFNQGH